MKKISFFISAFLTIGFLSYSLVSVAKQPVLQETPDLVLPTCDPKNGYSYAPKSSLSSTQQNDYDSRYSSWYVCEMSNFLRNTMTCPDDEGGSLSGYHVELGMFDDIYNYHCMNRGLWGTYNSQAEAEGVCEEKVEDDIASGAMFCASGFSLGSWVVESHGNDYYRACPKNGFFDFG